MPIQALISEYAMSHPRLPSSVQAARRVRRETVPLLGKGAKRRRSRLQDDMVESNEDRDRAIDLNIDSNEEITPAVVLTEIKLTHSGERVDQAEMGQARARDSLRYTWLSTPNQSR
jgi:hypothetical protein